LIGGYDVANGKYASGIYRLFMQNHAGALG
jgi:hypothetical protein